MKFAKQLEGRVLITGASGFIAKNLCQKLIAEGIQVIGTVRSGDKSLQQDGLTLLQVKSIDAQTDWFPILQNIDVVIHLAARVHILKEKASNPFEEFLKTNTEATLFLASQAKLAGVKKFIFLSSIGVNGESSGDHAFTELDKPAPYNYYTLSKKASEDGLMKMTSPSMKIVLLRAPLVYGPNTPGNFGTLVKLIKKGIPLPFSTIRNSKHFIYIENLVDALITCTKSDKANGLYLVSDSEEVSTPDLIRMIAKSLKKPTMLFPFPIFLLRIFLFLLGKSQSLDKLTSSLTIDCRKIRSELGWTPPFTLQAGIEKSVK